MKTTLLLFALAILPAHAALLTADLTGTPHDYGFYAGNELLLAARHRGLFSLDQATGAGLLQVRLEVTGGSQAAAFGGVGAQHTGSTPIRMDPSGAAMLWAGLLALPDQQYYWGGDHANDIQFAVGPVDFGSGICLGCGDMPMGSLYMFQGVPLLNYWTVGSTLDAEMAYSGDAVFRVTTTHTPESGTAALILIALVLAATLSKIQRWKIGRWRHWPRFFLADTGYLPRTAREPAKHAAPIARR